MEVAMITNQQSMGQDTETSANFRVKLTSESKSKIQLNRSPIKIRLGTTHHQVILMVAAGANNFDSTLRKVFDFD